MSSYITGSNNGFFPTASLLPSDGETIDAIDLVSPVTTIMNQTSFLSASLFESSGSIATDINTLDTEITELSSSVASDINLIANQAAISVSLYGAYLIDIVSSGVTLLNIFADSSDKLFSMGKRNSDNRSILYKSTNFGATWGLDDTISSPNATGSITSMAEVDSVGHFISNGSGIIFNSSDGGDSWSTYDDGNYGTVLNDMCTTPSSYVVVVGGSGLILRRNVTTSGSFATVSPADSYSGTFNAIDQFGDSSNLIAVGTGGEVQYSSTQGGSWTAGNTGTSLELYDVATRYNSATGDNTSITITANSILRSTDFGATWSDVSPSSFGPGSTALRTVFYLSERKTWIVSGFYGMYLYSTDDGLTWVQGQWPVNNSSDQNLNFTTTSNRLLHIIGYSTSTFGSNYKRAAF